MKQGRKLIKDVILLWKGDLRGIGSIHDEMKKNPLMLNKIMSKRRKRHSLAFFFILTLMKAIYFDKVLEYLALKCVRPDEK